MTDLQEHPFKPGVRVALVLGFDHDVYIERFVDKLYKSGRFTLCGSTQQWRPWKSTVGAGEWNARETGNSWSRRHVIVWDETTDAKIQAAQMKRAREQRFFKLRKRIEALSRDVVTDAMLDAIEAALPTLESAP